MKMNFDASMFVPGDPATSAHQKFENLKYTAKYKYNNLRFLIYSFIDKLLRVNKSLLHNSIFLGLDKKL